MNWIKSWLGYSIQTNFQQSRQTALRRDIYPPDQTAIGFVLDTIKGRNSNVRPQIAFSTIIRRMNQSSNKDNWIYLIKNLIVLDRILQQKCFVIDINQLVSQSISQFQDYGQHAGFKAKLLLNKYFKFLKMKSNLYKRKSSSYNVQRHDKKQFISKMKNSQIFEEFEQGLQILSHCLSFSQCSTTGITKFEVVQYVYQLLLYTLLNIYTSLQFMIYILVGKSNQLSIQQIKKLKSFYPQFVLTTQTIISFLSCHKHLKGYSDIPFSQFYKPDKDLGRLIQGLVKQTENLSSSAEPFNQLCIVEPFQSQIQLQVIRKSLVAVQLKRSRSKKNIFKKRTIQRSTVIFQQYQNIYCSQFDTKFYQKDQEQKFIRTNYYSSYNNTNQKIDTDSFDSRDNIIDPKFQGDIVFKDIPVRQQPFANIYFKGIASFKKMN